MHSNRNFGISVRKIRIFSLLFPGDQGEVHITIARWLTPNQRRIHGVGLTPDILVEMTDEDYQADRDPQLDQAIQVLLQLLGESTD